MSGFEIILLGIALSMDAFAVTISNMFIYKKMSTARSFLMPLFFGLFQGLMPLIGYLAGQLVSDFITQYAGIITFVILGFIGGKMIWDVFHEAKIEDSDSQTLALSVLLLQAIATSIDALAVGVSFAALNVSIVFAVSVIAITTGLCCIGALLIGKRFGEQLGDKATLIGGAILILIGVKSLFF